MHAGCPRHACGRFGSPWPLTRTSQQRSSMQSLQCVQSHPCVPRLSAAVVIYQFRNKKRQHINTSAGNSCPVPGHSGERSKTSSCTPAISLCLFPLSLKMTLHTLINVVITPSLKLPSRVAKVSIRSQLHVGLVGIFSRARTFLESRVETPLLPGLKSQVWRLGAKRCVNSLGV